MEVYQNLDTYPIPIRYLSIPIQEPNVLPTGAADSVGTLILGSQM